MKISTERKVAEAIKRMKALNIIGDAVADRPLRYSVSAAACTPDSLTERL